MSLHLRIYGQDPVAKGRPRMTKTGHAFTPAKTRTAESLIRVSAEAMMQNNLMILGPVNMKVRLVFGKPKSNKTSSHTQRPDADNCAKLITDALNGVAYKDDSQIVSLTISKEWGQVGGFEVVIDPA